MRALVLVLAIAACTTTVGPSLDSTVSRSGWAEVAPMRVARSEHPAAVLDGEIVVAGGFVERGLGRVDVTDSVEAYSSKDDSWQDLPDLPEPRHHGMAAVAGDRLFVLGGYSPDGTPTATVWELVEGHWAERAPLPGAVAAGAAAVLGDRIYVIGGVPNGALYQYEVALGFWVPFPQPTQQREHLAAVALNHEIWAIAGRWQGENFKTVEIYDPSSETWRSAPRLNESRSGFGAVVVDGMIVVAGGEVFDPNGALTSVEQLDTETGGWTMIEPLPYGLHGNPLVTIGTDLYLPGGSTRPADVENDGRTWRLSLE